MSLFLLKSTTSVLSFWTSQASKDYNNLDILFSGHRNITGGCWDTVRIWL